MILKPTIGAGVLIICCGLAVHARQTPSAETPRPEVTKAQVQRWMTELSNWGRWGKDDQLGTLNLITPEKRRQAQALAKRGVVVSLEQPVALVPMPEATKRDGRSHASRSSTYARAPAGRDGFFKRVMSTRMPRVTMPCFTASVPSFAQPA